MANQSPTEEKMHYESLMGLFKYALTFFSVIAIVITFLIGNNLTEIKKTISEDVKESAKKLETVKTDADKTVADTKADAKQQLADMKLESQLLLNYTKDLTTMQISLLKEDAKNLALSSARNKVEEAFKNNNVQTLIDITARKEVNDKLKEVVKEETDKTREVFSSQIQLAIAFDQIARGNRESLNFMDSISNYAENEVIRKFSKELLIQKGIDYENNIVYTNGEGLILMGKKLAIDTSQSGVNKSLNLSENAQKYEIIRAIVLKLKTELDLDRVTFCFMHLRKLSGINFKTFDSKPVYDWYNSNYKKY